jgi:hypothetical protein
MAEEQELLRTGINKDITKVILWESLVNIFNNENLKKLTLHAKDVHKIVKEIFLYGILKQGN